MIPEEFLGIVIYNRDDFGKILLRLSLDLWISVQEHGSDSVTSDKALNIIKVCCEPMFDDLIEEYDWNLAEVVYAERLLVLYMDAATVDLLALARRRVKRVRKVERQTKLQIDDLRIATMMAQIMMACDQVRDQLEETFMQEHGAMYFSR